MKAVQMSPLECARWRNPADSSQANLKKCRPGFFVFVSGYSLNRPPYSVKIENWETARLSSLRTI